jgi:hypothetical protein
MQTLAHRQKLFERLQASINDFAQAKFCVRYLLKKKWHYGPWERRMSIYEQQTAFVTALIVAYARPFTRSKGWPNFPKRLVPYDTEQWLIHEKVLALRDEIFAHSDSQHFKFDPFQAHNFRTTIERVPFVVLSAENTEIIGGMIEAVLKATRERAKALRDELLDTNSPS